jgi:hypothetical protein
MKLTKKEIKAALNAGYTHREGWGRIYKDGRIRL